MINQGHIKLRRGLLEHINSGQMKADMLSVYTYLLLRADYNCGVVWSISAPYIGMALRKQAKHINRQLIKLEKENYIKRFSHRGQIASYPILINKYLVFNGVLIDADNTSDINELAWTPVLNGAITGSYREVKCNLSVFYVSPFKEIKNLIIKEVKEKNGEIFDFSKKDKEEKTPKKLLEDTVSEKLKSFSDKERTDIISAASEKFDIPYYWDGFVYQLPESTLKQVLNFLVSYDTEKV